MKIFDDPKVTDQLERMADGLVHIEQLASAIDRYIFDPLPLTRRPDRHLDDHVDAICAAIKDGLREGLQGAAEILAAPLERVAMLLELHLVLLDLEIKQDGVDASAPQRRPVTRVTNG